MFSSKIIILLGFVALSYTKSAEVEPRFEILGHHSGQSIGRGAWYLIDPKLEMNWDNALKVCEAQGLTLVQIYDIDEDSALSGFLSSHGHKQVWTAGNDLVQNGEYYWKASSKPFEYANWFGGSSPEIPECGCVSIKASETCSTDCDGKYEWHEEACSLRRKFVCEFRYSSFST